MLEIKKILKLWGLLAVLFTAMISPYALAGVVDLGSFCRGLALVFVLSSITPISAAVEELVVP